MGTRSEPVMKRNGFTLVELLAALTITSVVLILAYAIFHSGIKQGDTSKKEAFLQQEAELIAEAIRNKHLKDPTYQLEIKTDEVVIDGMTISKNYRYLANIVYENHPYTSEPLQIDSNLPLEITLKIEKGDQSYTLRTIFARGISDE